MNDEQSRTTYQQLIRILEKEGLNWVIDLATDDIESGKILKQRQNTQESLQISLLEQQSSIPPSGSKGGMNIVIEDYTNKEKLKILIDIIKQTVVDTTLMESKVVTFFQDDEYFTDLNADIRFTSSRQESFSLSLDNIVERKEQAYRLMEFLQELKEEVEK